MSHEKLAHELVSLLKTIKERVKEEEIKKMLDVGIVGAETFPDFAAQGFIKEARRPALVQALRERNFKWASKQFAEIAEQQPETTRDMWVALSSIPNEELETIVPMKKLTKVFALVDIDINLKVTHQTFRFNEKYEEFLMNMITAFAGDVELLNRFVQAAFYAEPNSIIDAVRPLLEPELSGMLVQTAENKMINVNFFSQLPYVKELKLGKYWKRQITDNPENYACVAQLLGQLAGTVIGLPMQLFDTNLITDIKDQVFGLLESSKKEDMVNADGSVNMTFVMNAATELLTRFEANGAMEALQKSIENESFDLNPEMIKRLTEGQQFPPEFQLMLEAATVNSSDPFESKKTK